MNVIQQCAMRSVWTFTALLCLLSPRTGAAPSSTVSELRLNVSKPERSQYYALNGNKYVVHTFLLSNCVGQRVEVDRIQTACGCTTVTSERNLPFILASGKSVTVNLRIPLNRLAPGPYEKKAWVYCSAQTDPLAELDASGNIPSWRKPLPIPTSVRAPDFTLKDLTGKPFHLMAQRGKSIVMFSFCGCPECTMVARRWSAQQRENRSLLKNSNYICVVDYTGPPTSIKAFLRSASLGNGQCSVLIDPNTLVGKLYHVDTCPRSFVIDKDGTIDYTNNHPDDRPYGNRAVMVQRTFDSLFAGDLSP